MTGPEEDFPSSWRPHLCKYTLTIPCIIKLFPSCVSSLHLVYLGPPGALTPLRGPLPKEGCQALQPGCGFTREPKTASNPVRPTKVQGVSFKSRFPSFYPKESIYIELSSSPGAVRVSAGACRV